MKQPTRLGTGLGLALAACITLGCGGSNNSNSQQAAPVSKITAQAPLKQSLPRAPLAIPSTIHATIQIGDIDKGTFCNAETLNPTADISDIKSGFNPNNWLQTITGIYERRWPSGKALAQAQANDQYFKGFVDTTSFNKLAESLMVAIHEETHMWIWPVGAPSGTITPTVGSMPPTSSTKSRCTTAFRARRFCR